MDHENHAINYPWLGMVPIPRAKMVMTGGWGPQDRVQLPYKWLNSTVCGRYKWFNYIYKVGFINQLITGGHHGVAGERIALQIGCFMCYFRLHIWSKIPLAKMDCVSSIWLGLTPGRYMMVDIHVDIPGGASPITNWFINTINYRYITNLTIVIGLICTNLVFKHVSKFCCGLTIFPKPGMMGIVGENNRKIIP